MLDFPAGKDANGLDETDPMAFLVGNSEDIKSKLPRKQARTDCPPSLPNLSPPPVPKCAPPPLLKPKLSTGDDIPPPLPSSPIPTGNTAVYMNGEQDISSLVSRLKAELFQAHQEKMVAIKERDKLQEELDCFLGSAEMLHEAKEALHAMRSERQDSAKSEQALKAKLKDRRQETELLQKESKSMKKLLDESKKKAKDLEEDRDTLTFIRSSLQKKMAEAKEDNDHLTEQLKKTENELADSLKMQHLQQQELEKTRDEVGHMVTTFEEKLQLMQVENDALIDDIRATRATAKRHRKHCQDLELEKKQLETEKSKLETKLVALKKTVTDAGQSSHIEMIALEQQVAEASTLLQQQKDESTKQTEKLQSRVTELETETANVRSEMSTVVKQAVQQKKTLLGKVSDLERSVQELEGKLPSTEKKNQHLEEQLKNAQQETKSLLGTASQLNNAKEAIEKLEKEREDLRRELETVSSQSAGTTVSELQTEKEKMHKEIQKYQETVKVLETDKKDMMDYMVELEEKLDKSEKANTKTSDLKKEANEMRENWKEEKNRVTALGTDIRELKTEIEELKKAKDDLQRETKHKSTIHSEEVQSFHNTLQDLQQELEQRKKEKETIQKTLQSDYETKLAKERRKSVSVESQMALLQNQHSALEMELSETKVESNRLRSQLSSHSKRLSTDSLSSSEESSVFSISTVEEVVEVSLEDNTAGGDKVAKPKPDTKSPTSGPPPVSKKPVLRQINSGNRETSSAPSSPHRSRITIASKKPDTTDSHKDKDINEEKPNSEQQDTQSSPARQTAVITHSTFLSNGQTTAPVDSPKPPMVSQLTHKPSPPASPTSRLRWEQVKTVVVSTPVSKPSPATSQPAPKVDRITALPGSRIAAATKFVSVSISCVPN